MDRRRRPTSTRCAPTPPASPGASRPRAQGRAGADPGLREAIGERALELDIPALIPGVDVGPPEPHPFEQAQRLAAEAWGAKRSWFLVNGASQGNHAACLALAPPRRTRRVQRNVHSSRDRRLVLAGLEPLFVAPEIDPDSASPTA